MVGDGWGCDVDGVGMVMVAGRGRGEGDLHGYFGYVMYKVKRAISIDYGSLEALKDKQYGL